MNFNLGLGEFGREGRGFKTVGDGYGGMGEFRKGLGRHVEGKAVLWLGLEVT